MTPWNLRSLEERALLNPAFGAVLVWSAARGASEEDALGLPFAEAFLVLPLVLHPATREALPTKVNSSLPLWIREQPFVRPLLATRAPALSGHTREALLFGVRQGLLLVKGPRISAELSNVPGFDQYLKGTSSESRECVQAAKFLGRWFGRFGDPSTVLALFGVRP